MPIYTFRCPYCETPHLTLGALLSCHPRQTRAAIDKLSPHQQSMRFVVGLCDTSPSAQAFIVSDHPAIKPAEPTILVGIAPEALAS